MMTEQEKKHSSYSITYKSFKFKVAEPDIGSISIEFQDINNLVKYATRKRLEQISYKTVVSALMESEPNILSIAMNPLDDLMYQMRVKVKLEYLNQIQEKFVFQGKKIDEERVKYLKTALKYGENLKKMKKQVTKAAKETFISGTLNNNENNNQPIFFDVIYEPTLFSINISFKKLRSNIVKIQFCYYDSQIKKIIPGNMLPDEMYVSEPCEFVVIGKRSSFSKAVLIVEGDFESMEYQVKCTKAKDASQKSYRQDFVKWIRILFIGLSIYGFYSLIKNIFFQSTQQSAPEM